MDKLKTVKFLVLLSSIVFSYEVMAMHKQDQDQDQDQDKTTPAKPSVPAKVGREAARIMGQAEDAGRKIAHGFKHQRHKDQRKQKEQK